MKKLKRSLVIVIVKFITWIFPPSKWYDLAISLVNFFMFFKPFRNKNKSNGLHRAQDLNMVLALMTRKQIPFQIPYDLSGLENFKGDCGIILCSVHIPLVKVTLRALIDNEKAIDAAVVARPPKLNKMSLWGINTKISIIPKNVFSLIKAKTLLENKGTLVLMIDHTETGLYSPNIMKLCGKVDAKVIYFLAALNSENKIESSLIEAPFPFCRTEEEISQNLLFLRKKHDEILENYEKVTF